MRVIEGTLFCVAILICSGIVRTEMLSRPQVAPAPLAFEVASIKQNVSGSGSSGTGTSTGLLRITNRTLKEIIAYAYEVRDYQISGGPGWMTSDRYDINAKSDHPAKDPEIVLMLRTLLSDRFQLQFHRETKDAPVYALLVGKTGPKLTPTKKQGGSSANSSRTSMKAEGVTMAELAANLSGMLERPVLDQSGLSGGFDFQLSWTPDADLSSGGSSASSDTAGPSIFTALQEQLGLRLESRRGPIEILMIDNTEKPNRLALYFNLK
jgi:uncharacterized protein (TIGR03435 family)